MVDVVTAQAANAAEEEEVQGIETPVEETAELEEVSSEQKEWDDILEEEDEDVVPEETEEVAEVVEEIPEEEVETEIPPEETPPEEEAAAEEVPEVEVPEIPEEEDKRTPDEVQKELTEARKAARENLVESFKWTEEQLEQYEENPGEVMSSMAADLFLDLHDSITQGLRSQMPAMVQGIIAQQAAVQENEQKFFGAWPQLAKADYRDTVDRIATMYRQQNPTTDDATAVREIGAQAWVALKLPLEGLVAHTQGAVTPGVETPQAVPTRVPASAGNTTQAARAPVQATGNEFEMMADELLNDDME